MRNSKRSGKRLLKKEHFKNESRCRWLSLLLSFSMVASLFSGVVSFHALAQEKIMQTEPKEEILEEITQTESEKETREKIKARLLLQIKEEGWDPYSADMSLDEFYALMEMFQEGILPLEEEDPVVEVSVSDLDLDEPDTEESYTEELDAEESRTEESNTVESDIDKSDTEESYTEESDTEESYTEESYTGGLDAEESYTEKSHAEESYAEESYTENIYIEESYTDESDTEKTYTEESDTELRTEEPEIEEPKTEKSDAEETDTEEPDTEESRTEKPDTEDADTEESDTEEPENEQAPSAVTPSLDKDSIAKSDSSAAEMEETSTARAGTEDQETEQGTENCIPRTMFLFGGLTTANTPGEDAEGTFYGSPLPYDNRNGHTNQSDEDGETDDYISGLDIYNRGYTRPPKRWEGVKVDSDTMDAVVIVPETNKDEPTIVGDVDQDLFLHYDGYYVRQVIAENNDVVVLGVIKLREQNTDTYIYYYATIEGLEIEVSATTLPEGQKFIIQYSASEYSIGYEVKLTDDEIPGDDIDEWIDTMDDVTDERIDEIFGTDRPIKTNLGEYSFTAQSPDYYTLSFYLKKKNPNGTWAEPELQLGTKDERTEWKTKKDKEEESEGLYTDVNDGWALGMEPVYNDESEKSDFSVRPNTNMGPKSMTTNGTFYNPEVKEDRIIIAVLRKKPEPEFSIKPVEFDLAGVYDENDTTHKLHGRGTSAAEGYDWEAEYAFQTGLSTVDPYPDRPAGYPNLGKVEDPTWDWGRFLRPMKEDPTDGTYSYSWTFQTNAPERKYYLDGLEVNGVGITVPFFPKYVWSEYSGQEDAGVPGTESGVRAWYTETVLPDGAVVRVEYLLVFSPAGTEGFVQRHYRISVRNARANVTITGMNLMLYSTGQPEFSVYELDGVTGATVKGNAHVESIQYYDRGKGNKDYIAGWSENQYKANVILSYEADHDSGLGPRGIDYYNGDTDNSGANIRFKLAEGYDSPYYLYESLRDGTILGTDGKPQASAERENDTGRVKTEEQNPVVPYVADGTKPWMKYDSDTGEPIPVTKDGNPLYYYDEDGTLKQFTDWSQIRIREVEETVVQPEGGTEIIEKQVLYPELYDSGGKLLGIEDVIAPAPDEESDDVIKLFKWDPDVSLKSQYIYEGADGWYYIRVSGQGKYYEDENGDYYIHASQSGYPYKIALLTIVAHPVRYVVRYKPEKLKEFTITDGTTETTIPEHDSENMPEFVHGNSCLLFPQSDADDDKNDEDDRLVEQFDDNAHNFYDIIDNTTAAVSSLQPTDPLGYYKFVDWVLVDRDDNPVLQHVIGSDGNWMRDEKGEYIMEEVHFPISGSIDIPDASEFAFVNYDLGPSDVDIYVLRLKPSWERIEKPFHYTVALNWIDASGQLHADYFADLWQEILTDYELDENGNGMTVKVLTGSTPFQNWIAMHPTYSFWDSVNNATQDSEIEIALGDYLPEIVDKEIRLALLEALCLRDRADSVEGDDFDRKGNYIFTVNEDRGTLVLWMYEDKGNLVFHKDVDAESFIYNDEFYFTVDRVTDGKVDTAFNGVYKAYPEKVCDEITGEERKSLDKDAWLVRFEEGKIVNIVKNDGSDWPKEAVTYFTLHDDEGIILTVPEGQYAVHELGSKSGGSYMVEVEYRDKDGNTLPEDGYLPGALPKGIQWLKGREKTYQNGDSGISQVSLSPVQIEVGEDYIVYTNFSNQTSTVAFEKTVVGPYEDEEFGFKVTLILPDGTEPLKDTDGGYDYFNFNLYNVEYEEDQAATEKSPEPDDKKSPEHDEWHNWRPEGILEYVTTGRVVVERDPESTNTWVSQYLLVPQNYDKDDTPTSWGKLNGRDGIWLTSSQRLYVVCTVPDSGEEINYYIEETDPNGYKLAGDTTRKGHANAAELAYELFINSKLSLLPTTGGAGLRMFWASGIVFLMSGIGLAWLNRDLWKRRWRFEA